MEEELETAELKEKIDEHVEHAAHAAGAHGAKDTPSWTRYLSLSTAVIAVFAAVASLMSGSASNEAILDKSEAMLHQSQASDQWAFYQAKGLKGALATNQVQLLGDTRPELAHKLEADAARYKTEADGIATKAKALEEEVAADGERSAARMERHHKFAITVTLLQIAIALSAIAALTKRKPMWFLGMAVSAGGLVMFGLGLV
jgi:rubrerythrin